MAPKLGAGIVNPDAIRLATYGKRYWQPGEPRVWAMAMEMAVALFLGGHKYVIVDATNITLKRRIIWTIGGTGRPDVQWQTYFKPIMTSEKICIERAGTDQELVDVIKRMAEQFEPLGMEEHTFKEP